MTSAVVYPLFM